MTEYQAKVKRVLELWEKSDKSKSKAKRKEERKQKARARRRAFKMFAHAHPLEAARLNPKWFCELAREVQRRQCAAMGRPDQEESSDEEIMRAVAAQEEMEQPNK
jgi:hypothetical protein